MNFTPFRWKNSGFWGVDDSSNGANPTSQLTPSERRIVKLIAESKSSKEIGEELSIHYRTV